MSNKLPVLTELPIISSKIQIQTGILSKQSDEFKTARREIAKSSELVQMGSGIPERKQTTNTTTNTTTSTTYITEFSGLHYLKLLGIIGFLIFAGGAYWFYGVNKKL